jgi:hypothetical protein
MTLPKWIMDKKAIVSMKCDDDECFRYAVTLALNPTNTHHPGRITAELREQSRSLNWEGTRFSVPPENIGEFEEKNSIGINLIGLSGNRIIALKVSGWKYWRIVTLFFHEDRYYVVKNVSRLWSSQISRSNKSRIFCDRCLSSFHSTNGFDKHFTVCYPLTTPVEAVQYK